MCYLSEIMFQWKDISCNTNYEVSNYGHIRNKKRNLIRKHSINGRGYPMVKLCKNSISKTYSVHRLVSLAFIPNPDKKPEVDHKNEIKTDNRVDNLQWATRSEQMKLNWEKGNRKQNGGWKQRKKKPKNP